MLWSLGSESGLSGLRNAGPATPPGLAATPAVWRPGVLAAPETRAVPEALLYEMSERPCDLGRRVAENPVWPTPARKPFAHDRPGPARTPPTHFFFFRDPIGGDSPPHRERMQVVLRGCGDAASRH